MRITVFGYPHTSKTAVETRLSELHKLKRLSMVVGWTRSPPSRHAYEWADRKGINCALVGGDGTPIMGILHGKRAEIGAIFKTYVPHRLVVFGDEALTEGGAGRMFAKAAEKYGSELVYALPLENGTTVQERCGELSPDGRYRCSRHKNHLGKYHYLVQDGRHVARFEVKHDLPAVDEGHG